MKQKSQYKSVLHYGVIYAIRLNSLQDEMKNVKKSAEESCLKADDQAEQMLAVMTTIKDEHCKVS